MTLVPDMEDLLRSPMDEEAARTRVQRHQGAEGLVTDRVPAGEERLQPVDPNIDRGVGSEVANAALPRRRQADQQGRHGDAFVADALLYPWMQRGAYGCGRLRDHPLRCHCVHQLLHLRLKGLGFRCGQSAHGVRWKLVDPQARTRLTLRLSNRGSYEERCGQDRNGAHEAARNRALLLLHAPNATISFLMSACCRFQLASAADPARTCDEPRASRMRKLR